MEQISIKSQEDLDEIISDTSVGGKLITFYEMLQESLTQYSVQRIQDMRDVLTFTIDEGLNLFNSERKVEELSKLEVIYYYSLLP